MWINREDLPNLRMSLIDEDGYRRANSPIGRERKFAAVLLISFKPVEAFRPRHPRLAELMERAEDDVLAYKSFPKPHWLQIHSTNPLERLNKEIKRRTNTIGIFPNEAAVTRLVGALMLEQNHEWAVTRRYRSLETVRDVCNDATVDAAQIASI